MKITYENKVNTRQSSTPRINKGDADDFNEIKTVVNTNANINEYSISEQIIGKWGDKDLYRKRLEIDYSDITIENGVFKIDLSSLNPECVMVDFSHSYYKRLMTAGSKIYNEYGYLNNIATHKSSISVVNDFSKQCLSFSDNDNTIIFRIGTSISFDKLYLTIEYTKK